MISFVYFDVGGVVITDLASNGKWNELKKDLGVTFEMDSEFEKYFDEFEYQVNIGRHHMDEILPELKTKFKLSIPSGYSIQQDMIARFHANPSIWQVIDKFHTKCRLGLLTNIYPHMLSQIAPILPPVNWDVIVDSSLVHLAKPDPKIFSLAQDLASVPGSEILFIDNTPRHLTAAKQFGWQTFLYNPSHSQESSLKLAEIL